MPLILRREPALWLGLVAAIVKLSVAFGLHTSTDQQALINALAAALMGVAVAVVAHDALAAPILGALQAAMSLAVGLGLHWSADRQAVVMAAAAAVAAMWTRTQITALPPAATIQED